MHRANPLGEGLASETTNTIKEIALFLHQCFKASYQTPHNKPLKGFRDIPYKCTKLRQTL